MKPQSLLIRAVMFGVGASVCIIGIVCLYISAHPNLGGQSWRDSQRDNVFEAVFRALIERRVDQTCFLAINEQAPSKEFMRRFRNERFVVPKTAPVHEGVIDGARGFIDPTNHRFALSFWIDAIHWVSDKQASVRAGGAAAGLSGSSGVFDVVWDGRQWKVTRYTIDETF